jgi:hypothetical protein
VMLARREAFESSAPQGVRVCPCNPWLEISAS